jgi:hypothetical protein
VPEQRVICVLGMHRSGTSLVTRLLNLLGVYLGPEKHLMPPTAANPRGYWEHQLLTDLDDEVLARLGGSWDAPPPVSSEMFAAPELADVRRRARALLATEFGDAPLWGWKDPRTSLVLPFWQRLVQPAGYVICLRDPLDVARSLVRSDEVGRGVELWLRYTHDALAYTLGHPRLLVFYSDVLGDWRSELRRLAAFVGVEEAVEHAEWLAEEDNTVDLDLAHHRRELFETMDDPRLAFPAKALYLTLRLARELTPDAARVLPHGMLEAFATAALEVGADARVGSGQAELTPAAENELAASRPRKLEIESAPGRGT